MVISDWVPDCGAGNWNKSPMDVNFPEVNAWDLWSKFLPDCMLYDCHSEPWLHSTEVTSSVWFMIHTCKCRCLFTTKADKNYTTAIVLWSLYKSNCVIQHFQLRTRRFCWCKVLLPRMPLLMATCAFGLGRRHWSYDTIRDAILTCTWKPTWVSLICCTEPSSVRLS